MHVYMLCADFGIPVNGDKGASVHLRAVARALGDAGARVSLAALRWDATAVANLPSTVRCIRLPLLPGPRDAGFEPVEFSQRVAAALRVAWADDPADVLYERAALWCTAGVDLAREAEVPHLVEWNAPLTQEAARWRSLPRGDAAVAAESWVARHATRVLPVSRPLASFLESRGARPERVSVTPNGVDAAFVRAGATRLATTAPPVRNAFTLGFSGSLKPWHGLDTLIAAFRLLGGAHAGYRVLIVGDGPLAATLREEALTLPGLTLAGAQPHDSMPSWLDLMDIAVAPYREYGAGYFSPLKVAEYQAAGVPVIASGGIGVRDAVEGGATGVLVPCDDAAALAQAVMELRQDPERGRRLARAAHAAAARWTWRDVAEHVLAEARTAAAEIRTTTGRAG